MDVRINKNDKIVEWDVGEKTITIHNEYVLFAFRHGKNMLMIKEKYESLEKGVSTYDQEGNIVFSYKYFGNQISFREKNISGIDGAIISVDYEEDHFMHEPTINAMNFLEQVQRQINEMGIAIECHISEE